MINQRVLSSVLVVAGASFAAGAMAEPDATSDPSSAAATEGQAPMQSEAPATKQHSPMETASFDKLDINQNGYISESEAQAAPTLAMKRRELDENGDGQLDRTEFSAFEGTSTSSTESETTSRSETMSESDTASEYEEEPMQEETESDY